MKRKLRFNAVLKPAFCVLFLSFSMMIQAAYLKDVPQTLTQPNGEKLNCFATGDEFYHYLHDAEGFTIIRNPQTGWFVYATLQNGDLIPTEYVPNHVDPQSVGLSPRLNISAEKWLAKRKAFEDATPKRTLKRDGELNHGNYNNLIICVRFLGDPELGTTASELDSMFNANNRGSISMYNYFKHASYNQLYIRAYPFPQPEGNALLSYEDIHPRGYYQPYSAQTNPEGYQDWERTEREFSLLERACNYVSDLVPDSLNLDYNNDGSIDNVVFVVKGNVGDWNDLLWPHRWSLFDRQVYINGKQVWDFNFQMETSSYFTVSTLCHEMFHSLGAPDLYHYNYDLSPVGGWDLMCSNSTPPQHSGAYMKHKYGNWIDEIPEITEYGTYTLDAIGWEGNRHHCYKIATSDPNQFYLLEYRNKDNMFESGLVSSGVLIYRIDTRFTGCASYNGYDEFDEVYIFRPGGNQTTDGVINTANFAADYHRTSINHNADPYPFLTGDVIDESFNICNITEIGNTIQFTFCPINTEIIPSNLLANVVTAHDVNLSWDAVERASEYKLYRDGQLLEENVVETYYYDHELADGCHKYYVTSVVDGEESFRSEEKSVIIGGYCNLIFTLNAADELGWQGAGLFVDFTNDLLDDVEYTLYRDTFGTFTLPVPEGEQVSLSYISGWEDANNSFSVMNEDGVVIYESDGIPQAGNLVNFVSSCEGVPCAAPTNLTAVRDGSSVLLTWSSPVFSDVFEIYRDGELIATSPESSYIDDAAVASGTHTYKVAAPCVNEPLFSNEVYVTIMGYTCSAPINLVAENQDVDNIVLTWEAPESIEGGLQYDDGEYQTSIGSANMVWGIKIMPENLALFEGSSLVRLSIFDAAAGEYKFKIYSGDAVNTNNLLLTQTAEMTASNSFVFVDLDESILIDVTQPLWITVQSSGATNPGPCCNYVGDPNSALIKSGGTWNPLPMYNMNYSWLLRAFVTSSGHDLKYNLYRNGDFLVASNILEMSYTDRNLYVSTHCYRVKAVLDGRESTEPSNRACATVSVQGVEDDLEQQLSIFPNPTKNVVLINGKSLKSIEVFDLLGQKLLSITLKEDSYQLDLSQFGNGVYVVNVESAAGKINEKITVIR